MINRQVREYIEKSIKQYPVVGIVGPRQIGKTTLARTITEHYDKNVVYLDLELPSDLNKLQDPELYLSQFFDSLVVIDEIQRMPSLFPLLRALVDKRRISGRFLILGSASPDLIRQASESLAGRIIYHEISPFHANETGHDDVQKLWLRGGFPLSYLAGDDESFIWREAFIKTYLEMDIPQLGFKIPSMQLRRFWTMLAHSHGQLWNACHLAKSLGISAPTVRTYLDILEETFVVRRLQPYHINIKKRLIKSPKIYIRDSGLLHALLSIRTIDALQSHPLVGSSWEGFVIEQIIGLMQKSHDVYFYRTNAGAEIDLVVFDRKNRPIAIEIKYSASPKVEKGYWIAYEDLSCKKGFIVYPGDDSYPIRKNVFVLPLKDLEMIFE
jgi:uncharacterized protein